MKRFDPSYEKLLSLLPKDAGELRMISVEVQDPDSGPSTSIRATSVKTDDISRRCRGGREKSGATSRWHAASAAR